MCECSLVFVSHVLRQKKCTMIKSFAIEIISINRRKKKPDVIHNKHSHWHDVDRWTWWSVNPSKPSSVDSLSSSDWFSRELLGRQSLDSSSECFESDWPSESWTWGVVVDGCLTSQQHVSVSQGRICTDNFTCCHTETEVADQTFHLTQSQYTDTGPTSPSTDPIMPGAWQGSHWSANV